jgi:hypothetical protein
VRRIVVVKFLEDEDVAQIEEEVEGVCGMRSIE